MQSTRYRHRASQALNIMRIYILFTCLLLYNSAQAQTAPAHWQFLVPNQYHSNEAPTEPGAGWLALTAVGGVWRLESTKVRATRIVDAIVDEVEGQKTGVQISSDHDEALALLRIPGVKPGKVDTPNMKFKNNPREMSITDKPLEISFKGTVYAVEPTQAGIFLKSGVQKTLLTGLSAENSEDENSASLLWAGDLDGDGKLDLLFSYGGYNKFGSCLYLSAGADKDDLIKQAACHGGIGC